MACVVSNAALGDDFFLLRAEDESAARARAGQFYMLRAWGGLPPLSRPVSVHDADGNRLAFLFKRAGEGTARFAALRPGDSLSLLGPLGNPFPLPEAETTAALVGGGAGVAPLYLLAKAIRAARAGCRVSVFLGFRTAPFLERDYRETAASVSVNVGGMVTDGVEPERFGRIYACGPEPMLRALYAKCAAQGAAERLYVSLESRMACGVGACYGCSRPDAAGVNRKVCRDGPVFAAREVFG